MLLLTELGVDGNQPAFQRGADFMLSDTQEGIGENLASRRPDLECLWGNILRYMAHAGFGDDPRITTMINFLRFSALECDWRCPHNANLPCAWGAARVLWGMLAIPNRDNIPGIQEVIDSGIRFLIENYSLVDANYPGSISPYWFKLNFPLFYQADILFVLRILQESNALQHPAARPALSWLAAKRGKNGVFNGSSPFRQRTYAGMGNIEETNRWVTLQAELVLKHQ